VRILSLSSCLPSSADPNRGLFVLHRLRALAELADVEVVHAAPWFPGYRGPSPAPRNGSETLAGLRVHHRRFIYVPRFLKGLDAAFYARGLSKWLAGHVAAHGRPDVLDVHFVWPDGVAACRLAGLIGVPFTITLRGKINSRIRDPRMRPLIAAALRQAAHVISVSRPMAETARTLGVEEGRVSVIPNGVDMDAFKPIQAAEARRELGLDPDCRYIVCVAAICPEKGLPELVEALAGLPEDVRLLLVGDDDSGGRNLAELNRLAIRQNCVGRMIFAGVQPHERVPLYLNAADLTVLASHAEGCPNVVLESLACGRPVVATSVGQVPEMIQPGVNGEIVAVGDASALAAALRECLGRPWRADEIRLSPAVRSWRSVAEELLPLLANAAGKGP
jgi:teichuronic acid biosynthesis glycosyltransferase TuaC